jgi:hypothetical protein
VAFAFRLVGISAFESIREDFLFPISRDRSSFVYSRIAVRSYAIWGNAAKVVESTPGGRIKGHLYTLVGYFSEGVLLGEAYIYERKSQFL